MQQPKVNGKQSHDLVAIRLKTISICKYFVHLLSCTQPVRHRVSVHLLFSSHYINALKCCNKLMRLPDVKLNTL